MVLEWADDLPATGEVQPLLLDLVDRGIIRILDIAFLAKDRDGSVSGIEVGGALNQLAAAFAEFEGASSATASPAGRPSAGSNRGPIPTTSPSPSLPTPSRRQPMRPLPRRLPRPT